MALKPLPAVGDVGAIAVTTNLVAIDKNALSLPKAKYCVPVKVVGLIVAPAEDVTGFEPDKVAAACDQVAPL